MRYLFGFLCVCALGPMPLIGCGETGGTGGAGGDSGEVFPCTEQGIRDAIKQGGGPYTFDCDGPMIVKTKAEIAIDNDVVLDGEGNLTIDANLEHRVLWVNSGTVAELRNLTVTAGRLTHNVAVEHGAGIYNEGLLTLTNSRVWRNEAAASGAAGGGIVNAGTLTLTNSTVSENSAGLGLEQTSTAPKSTPPTSGGGIVSYVGATLTLLNSTVAGNSADHGGGIRSNGPLTVLNSTLSGNTSEVGGGVYHSLGQATLTNTTISDNTASYYGGGVYNISGEATLAFTNSTLSSNVASDGRAVWSDGPVSFGNTLIDGDCRNEGRVNLRGGNIESPGDTCGFNGANVTADALKLGSLRDNGGPTLTQLPGPGSVAIDAIDLRNCTGTDGLPLRIDQRGVERPKGPACDVGAVEAPSPCEGIDCDDQNQCTLSRCDPVDRTCSHPPVFDHEPCDFDGVPGRCLAGVCIEDPCVGDPCNDSNECTTDFCDWLDGSCMNTPVKDGLSCNFEAGAGGTGGVAWYCLEGVCIEDPCTDNACDDDNSCTADSCSFPDGSCSNIDLVDGTPCMDDLGQCVEGLCEVLPVCGAGRNIPETATMDEGRLRCDTQFATFPIGITLKMAATPSTEIQQGENDFALQVEFGVDAETVDLALSRNVGVIQVESIAAIIDATMGDSDPMPVAVEEAPVPCSQKFEAGTPATFVSRPVGATWTLDAGQTLELSVQQFEELFVALDGSDFKLATLVPDANCTWQTAPPSVSFTPQP